MARQRELFPEPSATLNVDPTRGQPRLWVRRVVLWSEPGKIIRDIPLRRGLNIVWSPDPGADAAELGASSGSGHGAGKSLFCRLLRYCLGEDGFANTEQREAIGAAFPQGLVGAEIVVAGTSWSVIRPLGITRRVSVGEGIDLEDLLVQEGRAAGLAPLVEAITQLLPAGLEEHMPGTRDARSWLIALAWLARDQECRFGHLLEWRHSASNSGSPAAGLTTEQRLVVVRMLLDVITVAEMEKRAKQIALGVRRASLERELAFLEHEAKRLGPQLLVALGLDPSLLAATSLAAERARIAAGALHAEVDARIVNEDTEDGPAHDRRERLEVVIKELAVLRERESHPRAMKAVQEQQARALRGERIALDANELRGLLGPVCPVCNVPIDRALAQGCGLSHVIPDLEKIAADREATDAQLETCRRSIDAYDHDLRNLERKRRELETEERALRTAIRTAVEDARRRRLANQQEWRAASKLVDNAERLVEIYAEHQIATNRLASIVQDEEKLKNEIQGHRARHRDVVGRLRELFTYVCRAILGSDSVSKLELAGQTLRADVQVGGMAMESMKAIVFDIATLLMGIEGKGALPTFLVHDSPREADLGLSLYHKLFRFVAQLESLGNTPPFQYIITTTTEPPVELRAPPFLVATLSGDDDSNRLFRRTL